VFLTLPLRGFHSIDAVDEGANRVYFSGNRGNACERHLYSASLLPAQCHTLAQLTTQPGFHTATVCVQRGLVADCFSSITTPLAMHLLTLDPHAHKLHPLCGVTDSATYDTRLAREHYRQSMVTPVFHTIRSTDGKVDLHCALYLPQGVTFDPSRGAWYPFCVFYLLRQRVRTICRIVRTVVAYRVQ
jgi:hypothetical protein